MRITPYIQFRDGRCREALAFYAQVLGGRVVASTPFSDAPGGAPVSADWTDKVMHAQFEAEGITLFACDAPPQFQHVPQGIALALTVETAEAADRIFAALCDGAEVTMPIAETFWALRFGMLDDRFGVSWMVSCDRS